MDRVRNLLVTVVVGGASGLLVVYLLAADRLEGQVAGSGVAGIADTPAEERPPETGTDRVAALESRLARLERTPAITARPALDNQLEEAHESAPREPEPRNAEQERAAVDARWERIVEDFERRSESKTEWSKAAELHYLNELESILGVSGGWISEANCGDGVCRFSLAWDASTDRQTVTSGAERAVKHRGERNCVRHVRIFDDEAEAALVIDCSEAP